MRAKFALGPRLLISGGLLASTFGAQIVAASDAYDDEELEEQPEGFRTIEDEKSEKVEEGLQAGALSAPGAMRNSEDPRSQVEKDLDEAEEKDSGRGLEFAYLNGELGYQNVSLTSVNRGSLLAEGGDAQGGAFVYGVGLGARLLYFSLGARFRRASMSSFNLWSLVAEFSVRVPKGNWEPYGTIGAGYTQVGGLSYSSVGQESSGDIQGLDGMDLRLAGGMDYYFSDSFSVGAQLGGNMLFLSRPAHEGGGICSTESCPYDEKGSGVGLGMTSTILIGLHF